MGLSPEEIERRSVAGERFKTIFNMHRLEKTADRIPLTSEGTRQRERN